MDTRQRNFLFPFLVFLLALARYIPFLGCAPLLALSYKRQGISDMHLIQYDDPEIAFVATDSAINSLKQKVPVCLVGLF